MSTIPETVTVPTPTFGSETERAAQLLVDAAWKIRNGYSAGGSTVVASVAKLLDDAAKQIDPAARTTYGGVYPAHPGQPDGTVDLLELTYEERQALPAGYHRPLWDDLSSPASWCCSVCWGDDGETTAWPCKPARRDGLQVAISAGLEHTR